MGQIIKTEVMTNVNYRIVQYSKPGVIFVCLYPTL